MHICRHCQGRVNRQKVSFNYWAINDFISWASCRVVNHSDQGCCFLSQSVVYVANNFVRTRKNMCNSVDENFELLFLISINIVNSMLWISSVIDTRMSSVATFWSMFEDSKKKFFKCENVIRGKCIPGSHICKTTVICSASSISTLAIKCVRKFV